MRTGLRSDFAMLSSSTRTFAVPLSPYDRNKWTRRTWFQKKTLAIWKNTNHWIAEFSNCTAVSAIMLIRLWYLDVRDRRREKLNEKMNHVHHMGFVKKFSHCVIIMLGKTKCSSLECTSCTFYVMRCSYIIMQY
jgi:hypothetical protein